MNKIFDYVVPVVIVYIGFAFYGQAGGFMGLVVSILYLAYRNLPEIYMIIGSRAVRSGENEKAYKFFEKALNTGRLTPQYKLYYAYAAMRINKFERAGNLFTMILNDKKTDEKLRLETKSSYSMYLWKEGRIDEAIEIITEVYEKLQNTAAYGRLGFLLVEKGDYDYALKFNLEAYEYNSDDLIIADNLAISYYHTQKIDEALKLYDKIMEKKPQMPVIYYNYALTLLAVNEKEKAVEMLKKALEFKFSALAAVSHEQVVSKLKELDDDNSCLKTE